MNAFATAMNMIFADPNMAVDALWLAGGTGPGVSVRVIRKSPDEITPFGGGTHHVGNDSVGSPRRRHADARRR